MPRLGLDATSGLLAGEGHIPLACTPEPASAAPMTGGVEKCETTFEHEMEVRRIHESPRVTKPYTDEQWARIDALGHVVDEDLERGNVRLTMGGEPTFVSVDDRDGDEWNIAALGPNKRPLAADLLARLKGHYAPGGFVHFGQGKWYVDASSAVGRARICSSSRVRPAKGALVRLRSTGGGAADWPLSRRAVAQATSASRRRSVTSCARMIQAWS